MRLVKIKIGNRILKVKDCKGLSSLKGLMFDSMENHDGALIYSNSIWMPFVKHKLKLIFLDESFKVADTQNSIPLSFNPKSWKIYSCFEAKYCLETNKKVNVRKGSKIKLM